MNQLEQVEVRTKERVILFSEGDTHIWWKSPDDKSFHMGRPLNEIEQGLLKHIFNLRHITISKAMDYEAREVVCQHKHTVVESRGSMRFVSGDVDDDLTEVLVCTDCGKDLPKFGKGGAQ